MSDAGEALPRCPLMPGLYHVVPLGADRLEVCNAGRSVILSADGLSHRLAPLLAALDGFHTVPDLRRDFGPNVPTTLRKLAAAGLLVEGDSHGRHPETEAPLLTAIAVSGGSRGAEATARLRRATVVVAGCGAVGSSVAPQLARAGIGRLLLADLSPVTPRDLATSAALPWSSAGRSRADACAELCAAATPEVEAVANPPSLLEPAPDLVIIEDRWHASERGAPEADRALRLGIPYLVHRQDALEAVIGPAVARGGVPCHRCLTTRQLSHMVHLDEHLAYRRHRAANAARPDAFLAAHSQIVAGIIATEALRFLVGETPRTAGAALVVDLVGIEVHHEPVAAVPGCPGCAGAPM